PSGARPSGPVVLRGTSPSMALQPHELPAMLSVAAGGLRGPAHHPAGHGAPGHDAVGHDSAAAGWISPPMHPLVSMPAGLHRNIPDVAPFLPAEDPATLPEARPREVLHLADGDSLALVAHAVRRTIGGRSFTMYGFNGQVPGPLIRVTENATIVVGFTNRLPLPTAIHWHGVRLDNAFDGVPHVTQPPVPPGGAFRYEVHFPDAGLYWYHPHHREDILQDLGLYGNLRVDSRDPDYFAPVHREEVLFLDDLLVAEEGLVPYGHETATHALMGRFGNVLLVNGEPEYDLEVDKGAVVRFLLTNAASTRTFNVSFDGAPIKLVATDIGKFEREAWVESVILAPAERYIIEVRFEDPGRVALTNRVQALDAMNGNFFPEIDTLGMIAVADEPVGRDLTREFRRLRENRDVAADLERYRSHFDRPVDHELVLTVEADDLPFPLGTLFKLERAYFNPVEWAGTMPLMNWPTTGRNVRWILRDPTTDAENMDIDWRFRQGDVVKLRLTNSLDALHAMQHPIHVHGQRFLVLALNNVANENLAWKDTLLLPAGETATILLDLANPGDWMLHCHIAEHLEAGMKMVFTVQ
ncbi:MAG TPA: multicopper oxidase family protein, partial [Gemmatimonadota bacterium]|nr:multicopper oxidase family protein [Gemmatimonadota bacterium]